jgi:hypothetical protein
MKLKSGNCILKQAEHKPHNPTLFSNIYKLIPPAHFVNWAFTRRMHFKTATRNTDFNEI